MNEKIGIIYDWNNHNSSPIRIRIPKAHVELDDETLRDGLQGTQLKQHPTVEQKKHYVDLASMFVDHFDIGYPGSHAKSKREIQDLIQFSLSREHKVSFSAAARAKKSDIEPIVDLSNKLGQPIEVDMFFDGSIYRANVEGWDRGIMLKQLAANLEYAKNNKLPVMFVAERATATPPSELLEIFNLAIDYGADRLCIADTNGIVLPDGTSNIFRWGYTIFGEKNPEIKWDAHFHNDRGMALANCLKAAQEGVDRIHATALGIGERSGNVDLVHLLVNLNLMGLRKDNWGILEKVKLFTKNVSDILGNSIPNNTPMYGDSAFATSSGVHAAAINKETKGDYLIYFPFSPESIGQKPTVEIGPFSGKANVLAKLKELGINPTNRAKMVQDILEEAKQGRCLLTETTIRGIAERRLH
jgi:isopropylmalate/homocitrate/citramalate synthase